jgi:hypothetical protein
MLADDDGTLPAGFGEGAFRGPIPLRPGLPPLQSTSGKRLAVGVGHRPMPEPVPFCGTTGPMSWRCAMSALLVGYARCSTDQQDFTAQRDALLGLGVEAERIYVDHGLTGTNRERPGLREALAPAATVTLSW